MRLGTTLIYVIGAADGPVKVGSACDVQQRLTELQIGNPDELFVHGLVQVPGELWREIERAAHDALRDRHRRGEWFNVPAEEAFDLVTATAQRLVDAWEPPRQMSKNDAVEYLNIKRGLSAWTEIALQRYRILLNGSPDERKLARQADRYIATCAGLVAYNMFKRVIVEHRPGAMRIKGDQAASLRAEGELNAALMALAQWWMDRPEHERPAALRRRRA